MSTDDQLTIATIAGTASCYAGNGTVTPEREAEAIAELAAIASGRGDLLAEHAGILLGFADADHDTPTTVQRLAAARLCILAGADEVLVPVWREVGRKRAEAAKPVPYTGVGVGNLHR